MLHDGELVVYDSLAIMEYVNEAYPGPALLPVDMRERARARSPRLRDVPRRERGARAGGAAHVRELSRGRGRFGDAPAEG